MQTTRLSGTDYHNSLIRELERFDPEIFGRLNEEYERLQNTLQLIASESYASRPVLAALGSVAQNKTTEGYPGKRYHAGSQVVDDIERSAIERAKRVFKANHANVQPLSGSIANIISYSAMLDPHDRVLSLGLDQGGHLSHGASVSATSKFYEFGHYVVDPETFLLDYDQIREIAREYKPKLIVCGASAYPRAIDFKKFREIANDVGAYLMADISHISGLVIGEAHQSPIDFAHVTTTSTYKPGGPRGGLILLGNDFEISVGESKTPLWKLIDRSNFPGVQSTPDMGVVAAKAVFFKEAGTKEYRELQYTIIRNAQKLAKELEKRGYFILTGGTDNHMVLIDVTKSVDGLTGYIAEKSLEKCGIAVNKNSLPYDKNISAVASGIRLGTPSVSKRGMDEEEMTLIAETIDHVLTRVKPISDRKYELADETETSVKILIADLCNRFPIL